MQNYCYSNFWRLCRRSRRGCVRSKFLQEWSLLYVNAMFVTFHFFFRRIFQNHVVDSDYSCFTASSNGYHYCVPRHQEAQASSWVRKFPCRFSCLVWLFSPKWSIVFACNSPVLSLLRSRFFFMSRNAPPQFFFLGSVAWHPKELLRRSVSSIGTIFFFVLSRMSAFANELFRRKVVSLTSCFAHELFR